jgi:hypothetical protein
VHIGHPVAHGFVERVLECARTGLDRHDGGTEQFHAVHVGRLAPDVLGPHVDDAFHAVAGRDRGGGDAVLAGTGFGDHARLAHLAREHRLTDAVIHLVRAGVIEILALQVDLRTAEPLGKPPGMVHGARDAPRNASTRTRTRP